MSAKHVAKMTAKLLGTAFGLAIAMFLFSSVALGHANSGKGSSPVAVTHVAPVAPVGHVVNTTSHNNFNGGNFNGGNQWNGDNFRSSTGCGNCFSNHNSCQWGCSFVRSNPCFFSNGSWHECFNGCTVWFQGCEFRWFNGCWHRWSNGCWNPCHGLSFSNVW